MNLKTVLTVSVLSCVGLIQSNIASAGETEKDIPTSHNSPEGVAVDLVQAFITRDFHAFNEARAKSICEGRTDPFNYYVHFCNCTTMFKDGQSFSGVEFSYSLKRVSRVFSAQDSNSLTEKEGRSNVGAFVYGWSTALVDVMVEDRHGNEFLHRTFVVKSEKSGLWYANPKLMKHELLTEMLLQFPKSESVLWQVSEATDDRQ